MNENQICAEARNSTDSTSQFFKINSPDKTLDNTLRLANS
jgi:hypothetical protein